MVARERLHEAVRMTISAGYQLDKEAFEFLLLVSASEDPIEITTHAIEKAKASQARTAFIGRQLLEQVVGSNEKAHELAPSIIHPTEQEIITQTSTTSIAQSEKITASNAREVQSDLKVIEDPSAGLGSEGTIDDYLEYFRDRFRRTEKLLRQRIDVKSAGSIADALRAQPTSKLKIIGMITEKREIKQKIILNVEDFQNNITVLVPQNASEELHQKARSILLDQIVCLSATKTRSNFLIADDIILPEVGQRTPHRAAEPVYAVLTSDMHVGSVKFQRDSFNRFILWLNGKYGDQKMQEIAHSVKYVLIAGDLVDGVGVYPNQIKELAVKDIHKQYRLAARYLEQIPDHIEVIVIPGNHDAPRKALPQPAISKEYLEILNESRSIHSLGNPCYLSLHGVEVLCYHGRSLDDIIATVPDMSYDHPERAMKLLLQGRHLAPVYGEKTTLSPEKRDFMVIDHPPDIFHAGHVHVLGHMNYRGVIIVNSGGWQEQTEFMHRLGFAPTPGKAPVVNLQTLELTELSFN